MSISTHTRAQLRRSLVASRRQQQRQAKNVIVLVARLEAAETFATLAEAHLGLSGVSCGELEEGPLPFPNEYDPDDELVEALLAWRKWTEE